MKRLLFIILIIILAGCGKPIPPIPPIPPLPETDSVYRAFLVGVSKYYYFDSLNLPSPALNTEKLEILFNEARFGEDNRTFSTIVRLTNYDATKEAILNGILEVFADADDDDVSYFYYMGHGKVVQNCPVITPTDYATTFSSMISVHELEETLRQVKGTKVILLETCHSGSFIEKGIGDFPSMTIEIFANQPIDFLNKNNYQVLCSSAGDEVSYDNRYGGSYFCRYFIEGCKDLLADINYDGIIDLNEIYQYIKNNVSIQTVQIFPDGSTFPIYEK